MFQSCNFNVLDAASFWTPIRDGKRKEEEFYNQCRRDELGIKQFPLSDGAHSRSELCQEGGCKIYLSYLYSRIVRSLLLS